MLGRERKTLRFAIYTQEFFFWELSWNWWVSTEGGTFSARLQLVLQLGVIFTLEDNKSFLLRPVSRHEGNKCTNKLLGGLYLSTAGQISPLGASSRRPLLLSGSPAVYKSLCVISHHLVLKICRGGKKKKKHSELQFIPQRPFSVKSLAIGDKKVVFGNPCFHWSYFWVDIRKM